MIGRKQTAALWGLLAAAALFLSSFLTGAAPASAAGGEAAVQRLAAACTSARACLADAFLYDGKPIHPLVIRSQAGLPADARAVIAAVDLESAAGANQFCCGDSFEVSLDEAGHVGATLDLVESFSAAQRPKEDCPEGCWFAYRFHGSTAGGVQIVQTWERDGGSGTFSTLLFLKVRRGSMFDGEGWHQHHLITSLGKLNLGEAAEAPVSIKGDSVFLGAREIPTVN